MAQETGLRIMNNVSAQYSHRQLTLSNLRLNTSMEKLSSGYRINHAADDAAGLAISEKFRTQINGLDQASKNTMDSISMIQTAEGGLEELHSILQRMRTLSVQSANDTLTNSDRHMIQLEITELLCEIDRMQTSVQFNTKVLLTGNYTAAAPLVFHVGANMNQTFTAEIDGFSTNDLGLNQVAGNTAFDGTVAGGPKMSTTNQSIGFNVLTRTNAEAAIDLLSTAINTVSEQRAELGAIQNRLEHTFNFIGISKENQQAAESRIRDVDMASEMVNYTKEQIISQAAQSMLSQANMRPQSVLQMFQ